MIRANYAWGTLALALAWVTGCTEPNEYVAPPPPLVKTSRPVAQDVTIYHEEIGSTEAVNTIELRARVQGFLQEIYFEAGQFVEKGDPLFLIDPQPFEAKKERAQAALARAQDELRSKEAQYQRSRPLVQSGTITAQELLDYETDRDAAEATVAAAQAELREAELDLGYTNITAPISGRIGSWLVDKGNLVGSGEPTHLATIVQYDPIYANFSITERMVQQMLDERKERGESGNPETVPLFLKREGDTVFRFQGHVDYPDLVVDPTTGTYNIRGVFPNDPLQILVGSSVRIRMPISQLKDALLIPERAVSADRSGSYVFVVKNDNTVERRKVVLDELIGHYYVVQPYSAAENHGLLPEEEFIVEGLQRARVGEPVKPEPDQFILEKDFDGMDIDVDEHVDPDQPGETPLEPAMPAEASTSRDTEQSGATP